MTIINALPGIVPSLRNYGMGQWPQTKRKTRSGRTITWSLSDRPAGDRLELSWENITYAQAEEICSVWDANYGIYGALTLPPEIIAGSSGDLASLMLVPFPEATWQFSGPPRVEAVKARRCTVSIPIKTRGLAEYSEDAQEAE